MIKNRKYRLAILLCGVLLSMSLVAQSGDLIMEYNLFTDELSYTRDGVALAKPSIKAGQNLHVKIVEYNPYVHKVNLTSEESSYAQSSGTSGFAGIGGSGGFGGIGQLLGGLGLGGVLEGDWSGVTSSRGGLDQQSYQLRSAFEQQLTALQAIEEEINLSAEKINQFAVVGQSRNLAAMDVDQLLHSTQIRPSRVRQLVREEIQHAFVKSEGETISIDDLLGQQAMITSYNNEIKNYKSKAAKYKIMASQWSELATQVAAFDNESSDAKIAFMKTSVDQVVAKINETNQQLNAQTIQAIDTEYSKSDMEVLTDLRKIYEEIENHSFTHSFPPIQVSGDQITVELDFQERNESSANYDDLKSLKQVIPVTGKWKISGGVGLAFGLGGEDRYTYTLRDQKIVAEEQDEFMPIVASMVHFHRQSASSFNIGASFGLGFPITAAEGQRGLTFLAGPTVILGQQSKFLLSAGVMGTQVGRLGRGYSVGDQFDGISDDIPINQRYELGYFVGLSYSIF